MATGRVRLVYRYLAFSPQTRAAAEAADCAAEQGRFWEYHDELYEQQPSRPYSRARLTEIAGALGLDIAAFESCLASGRAAERVRADGELAIAKQIDRTPTFFIDGRRIVGLVQFQEFKALIEDALPKQ